MNRWFEFRVNSDYALDSLFLKHAKCGWIKWLSSDDDGYVALDFLLKHAQDHLSECDVILDRLLEEAYGNGTGEGE